MLNRSGQQKGNIVNIPVQNKKKSSSSNYTAGVPTNKMMNIMGSVSGSLQDKQKAQDPAFLKTSSMLNTSNKKLSNTSL